MARDRSVWLQVVVLALLFLGGGAFGVALSGWLAPESFLAQFVGLFSFSLPFAIGLQWWLGLAIAVALWRAVRRRHPRADRKQSEIPAGAIAFVPVCTLLVGFAGLLIGLLGSSLGVLTTVGVYLALGFCYGVACWLFARAGYLPFPRE